MANLWVVVTGLAVLVEVRRGTRSPNIVLLRQVPPGTEVPKGGSEEIPPHIPRLYFLPSGGGIPIGNRDVRFVPEGEGVPVITDLDPFLRVGNSLTEARQVGPEFLVPERSRNLEGWSRAMLAGGRDAAIWPIHVNKDLDLKSIDMVPRLDLDGIQDLAQADPEPRRKTGIGNGLLYYRRTAVTPGVLFSGDTIPLPWNPVPLSDTVKLPKKDNDEDHYAVWISNAAITSSPREDFDRDFYLLYDLLVETVTRFVPIIVPSPQSKVPDTPPGQCMIGYALG